MNDSAPTNQISSFVEPRYGSPIDTANGRPGGETKAARAFRCYIRLGRCLSQSESVGGRVALADSDLCRRHHEGDRAPAGRAMRKPDRGQGAGGGQGAAGEERRAVGARPAPPPLTRFSAAVLGGDQRRTWHRPNRYLPRRQRPAAGAHQRVLQRGHR